VLAVDTNVLVYAADADSQFHTACRDPGALDRIHTTSHLRNHVLSEAGPVTSSPSRELARTREAVTQAQPQLKIEHGRRPCTDPGERCS